MNSPSRNSPSAEAGVLLSVDIDSGAIADYRNSGIAVGVAALVLLSGQYGTLSGHCQVK